MGEADPLFGNLNRKVPCRVRRWIESSISCFLVKGVGALCRRGAMGSALWGETVGVRRLGLSVSIVALGRSGLRCSRRR